MHVEMRHSVERPVEPGYTSAGVTSCLLQHTQANLLHGLDKGDVCGGEGADVHNVVLGSYRLVIVMNKLIIDLWYDQKMMLAGRTDVREDQKLFILYRGSVRQRIIQLCTNLMEDVGRSLSSHNLAENTVAGHPGGNCWNQGFGFPEN